MSCNKAQTFFEQNRTKPDLVADTKKEKIERDQAWGIIRDKKKIYIAKGKTVVSFKPDELNKEETGCLFVFFCITRRRKKDEEEEEKEE